MVDFSSISDRNRVFEGGPYFYNHVGLFIKPWHSGFNATKDLPTRVPVWVRLPWLLLEFWREDILLRIAALLGKPAAIAQNTLEKKVFSYARICVEIDLNNPLPDSLEIFIGSASWIQPLDYESLPFRCRFCHEYGHLQRQCPRAPKAAGVSSSPSSGPSVEKGDKGKESGVEGGPDKDGFIPVKQRNKGRGHKRAFKDSQNDQGFNRFEVLDNQAVEEGIPVELSAGAFGMDVGMDTGLEKAIVVQNSSSALVQGSSEPPGASVDVQDDIVLADLAKAVFSSGKGRGSSPSLGVLQRPLKKGHFEFSSKVGRKKDADKLKSAGDLLETKLMVDLMFQHAPRIWFSGQCQCIGSRGTSGGLALFWDPRKVVPHWWISSQSAISMVASILESGETILVSNVYAPIDIRGKSQLWAHIRYVRSCAPFLPWILAGDFNVVLSLEEKRGGLPRLGPASDMFRTNVDSLALMDVKPSNGIFTWNNRRSGPEAITQRLDRFLVSCSWVRGSLVICSEILDWRGSDHWPIKFSTSAFPNPKNPPFKFQLMWLRDPSLGDLVAQWWRDGAPAYGTSMYSLIQDLGFSEALGHAESQALKLVEEWELREEIFWKQKARIDWLQEGDRNTAFFHYSVQARRNKCFISSLVNSEGISISAQHALSREARQYYSNLFTEDSVPAEADENRVLACIPSLISNEVNASLIRPVTLCEVEEVVFGMNKGKAPGPDGFPVEFFQEFWDIVKQDLLEVVCESLHSKQMLRALNATFLVLIPKKEGADKLDLFRPIALCNVAYKIITKLMAERLKSCLPMIISEEQGSFVAGRQILDGVVVASEAIHSMATSQERSMFIKLDMAKAYDRVKWSFLQKILLAFGFSSDWVSWVLSCVTSSSFSVIMNGEPSELFGSTRGLRQGDPHSPYLFIILAEGLGRLLKSQVSHGLIHGWQWGMGLPTLSHLQFVDDTSLMGLARIREADSFRKTLDIYLAASGQRVNEQKSSIFFFNTPQAIQHRIAAILRFQIGTLPFVYLGIPLTVGRLPRSSWQQLLDKLRRKVSQWTHRWLSSAARLTLLKSVIQALPIYRCFVQAAPMYFLKEFDALSRQFLWSGNLLSSKWSLVKWESVCRPKQEGGLGLRSASLNGKALAAKLYWRWCTHQHQLWARILNLKYLRGVASFEVPRYPLEGGGSMIWHTLKVGAQLIKDALFWICHSGSQALFWLDSWDGHPPILSSFPHLQPLSEVFSAAGWDTVEHYKVAQHDGLVLRFRWKHPSEWPPGGSEGDRCELSQLLASRACNSLRGTDVLAWDGSDLSGKYSVVAGYKQIGRQLFGDIEVPWWKHVWHKLSWPKCNFFMWLVAQNRCLTWDNLCKRGFQGPSMCVLCQGCEESVSHIFFQCSYAREIWHFWWGVWNTTCWHVSSLVEFWERWGRAPVSTSFLQAAWAIGPSFIIWNLWLERNRRIFQDLQLMAPHLWRKILHSLGETIVAKCDMTMRVDPRDVDCCNRLHLPPPQRQLMRNRCRHPTPKVNREGRWSPPPLGVLKINSDGSSRGNPGHAGIGGVGRDSSGDVQFIFSEYKGLHTNNLMEAQAILVAMERANQLGWRRIICESDSQVVVNLLKRQYMDNVSWQLALIVEQILTLCASLEHVTFNHIPREWNGVADCLAKWASNHMHDWNLVDRGHLPPDLSHQLDHLVDLDRAI
ncbi:uncharacterized protein LOC131075253 [Cryptomeria japonica]|uniref:uncharacterized protein LOC131075253 n=1 Tax=Cryptomeria japonica TaxID=3369 RepID=UPI0027DA5092|nr:uncharacterized protein LOC131075253 [Cryptomeria japonica]